DVEEIAAGAEPRADPDEGAEGADSGRHRQEEWKGGVEPVMPRREPVTQLVGDEDREERYREEESGLPETRLVERPEKPLRREELFAPRGSRQEVRTEDRRREEGQREERTVTDERSR